MATITTMALPAFGRAATRPEVPVAVYAARLAAARARLAAAGLDVLAVYGDREHAANLAYLTGFDPRFEEALLLLDADRALLLVGNECLGYLPDPALGVETALFQEFSLLGQPRGDSLPLPARLAGFGIRTGTRVGAVGWKYYADGPHASDLPAYLIDQLRALAGHDHVVNAAALFMHPVDGLRVVNEPEQLLAFEYASTITSDAVHAFITHLDVGVVEADMEAYLQPRGHTLSCHPMVGFGDKARRGLASASERRAAAGDPYTVAFGIAGALTCRAGCVAHGPDELSPALRDFYPRYAAAYYDVVAAWYRALRVGATGGAVFAAAEAARDPRLFTFAVNPGHLLHLDEWVHAPFRDGDATPLRSGMAVQMDIIPVSQGPFCYSNAEDGVILADAALRTELTRRDPAMMARVAARRAFMAALGIALDPSVLPLSNMPAWLPPYALAPEQVFTG